MLKPLRGFFTFATVLRLNVGIYKDARGFPWESYSRGSALVSYGKRRCNNCRMAYPWYQESRAYPRYCNDCGYDLQKLDWSHHTDDDPDEIPF